MDVEALEADAVAALERADSAVALEELRVRYLGRKSALKLALREVRDRESGMALNALRQRLEQAFETREQELERAELSTKVLSGMRGPVAEVSSGMSSARMVRRR